MAGGATGLLSFGLAGGLDPALRPGMVIVPERVVVGGGLLFPLPLREGVNIPTDPALNQRLGGATPHAILGGEAIAASAAEKHRLWQTTGAAAIDLESGAVARAAAGHGLPFAVLRVICDPAGRDLPPAALTALDGRGAIGLLRVIGSLIARPGQFPGLMQLAADAAAARRALAERVAAIGSLSGGEGPVRH